MKPAAARLQYWRREATAAGLRGQIDAYAVSPVYDWVEPQHSDLSAVNLRHQQMPAAIGYDPGKPSVMLCGVDCSCRGGHSARRLVVAPLPDEQTVSRNCWPQAHG